MTAGDRPASRPPLPYYGGKTTLAPRIARPASWPVLGLVAVSGPASWVVDYTDGDPLPEGSCGLIDPAVTQ